MIVLKFAFCCAVLALAGAMHTQELNGTGSAEAVTLSVPAASGDAVEAYERGNAYALGNGVAQNYTLAVELFQTAADSGLRDAQFALAHLYEQGLGVRKDDVQALKYFRMAAEQGHA